MRNEVVLSTETELFRFDGHLATLFTPKVKVKQKPFVVQASAIDSFNDKLYVYDYSLRYFVFDGEVWSQYNIPAELPARAFKGNPPIKK